MSEKSLNIFMLDDDAIFCKILAHFISLNKEYSVKSFTDVSEFLLALKEQPDIVTIDYMLPGSSGSALIGQVKELSAETKIIVISGQQDIQVAIDLFKKGVHDYITKDKDTQQRLWMSIKNLRETICLKKEVEHLQQEVERKYDFQKAIIGNSPAMKSVFQLMEKALSTSITVSLTGETGTGKELVAKSIHFNSIRKKNAFVPVNVAAIPKELLESELFGYEKGAFTGAHSRRIGKFEEAHKGTLFLDEIGEMDISLQAKLLRVLQEREISRIGSNEIIKTDVRILVATHRNLEEEVAKGNFREDLYYRLLGLPIHLPSLCQRGNDMLLIAKHFIEVFCKENGLTRKVLNTDAKNKLLSYSFPGNIRELKSIVELGCVLSDDGEIDQEHIRLNSSGKPNLQLLNETLSLDDYISHVIQQYLDRYDYDVIHVAGLLKVGKSTIYRMIKSNKLHLKRNLEPYEPSKVI
jgi:DNA-binding NtrC family response regulator